MTDKTSKEFAVGSLIAMSIATLVVSLISL